MRIVDSDAEVPAFDVLEPQGERHVPFVFNAPHSGTHYPRDLIRLTQLDRRTLRRSEDTFVDELFAGVTGLGARLMRANFPRVYVDLNRQADELDPKMFDAPLTVPANPESPRVAGGLGVIAKIVGERQAIYGGLLPPSEATERLLRYYVPYHERLDTLVDEACRTFGTAVLVDCHSMPSGAVRNAEEKCGDRPDVILGDRFGTSCSSAFSEEFARLLRGRGYVVGRNRPYAGGYITERHGRPPQVHAIQLEVNRALYMDEANFRRSPTFDGLRSDLVAVCADLIDWFGSTHLDASWPIAAE